MGKSLISVLTTIQKPTLAVHKLVQRLRDLDVKLIVIGDQKGPAEYPVDKIEFIPLEKQLNLKYKLARKLPTGHYARKNIGYLTAITQGATCIYETDDDNSPLPNWTLRLEKTEAKIIEDRGRKVENRKQGPENRSQRSAEKNRKTDDGGQKWVNVYKYFTDENIWPRGFPLEEITAPFKNQPNNKSTIVYIKAPIQQGLVNNSPDVDAIWRLVLNRPIDFKQTPSVYLPPQCWCPFNSQNTWWWPVAYPLLYLPSYCSFRVTDIWRSFIAQRCLWELEYGVVFHAPEVIQERNVHNLMKDFKDEIPCYTQNKEFVNVLERLSLEKGLNMVCYNLLHCYKALVEEKFFPENELELVNAWLEDLGMALW